MDLYLFDNEYNTVYENKIMNDVPLLDERTFLFLAEVHHYLMLLERQLKQQNILMELKLL